MLCELKNPNITKVKAEEKLLSFVCKIVENKQHHLKVLPNSFHLNGHALGFHPQTKKLESHLLTQDLTLRVKGLNGM